MPARLLRANISAEEVRLLRSRSPRNYIAQEFAVRFDRHVAIDRPDIRGRQKILGVHVKHLILGADVNLAQVAAKTDGLVGADLANIVNEAALRAARHDKAAVEMSDFEEAIDRVETGLEKKSRVMNPKEKETVAHHEAGHALVAESRVMADKVSKISVIPRGIGALGLTQQLPTEDRYLLKFGEASTGAHGIGYPQIDVIDRKKCPNSNVGPSTSTA